MFFGNEGHWERHFAHENMHEDGLEFPELLMSDGRADEVIGLGSCPLQLMTR